MPKFNIGTPENDFNIITLSLAPKKISLNNKPIICWSVRFVVMPRFGHGRHRLIRAG
ncbi:hypothetical protein EMIT053CA3_90174 [Pseudomonas donghuensis]